MSAERAAEAVRLPGARCPYCHEEVQRGVEPAVCVACHALHHTECMAEHGACSACGASHPRFAPVDRATSHPVSLPRSLGRAAELLGRPWVWLTLQLSVALVGLLIALELLGSAHDAQVGWVVLGGGLMGSFVTGLGGVRRGLGAMFLTAAGLLPNLVAVNSHVARMHEGPALFFAALFACVGLVVLLTGGGRAGVKEG